MSSPCTIPKRSISEANNDLVNSTNYIFSWTSPHLSNAGSQSPLETTALIEEGGGRAKGLNHGVPSSAPIKATMWSHPCELRSHFPV